MKNTDHLISDLTQDLKTPTESRFWFSQYWFSWISCISLMAVLTYLSAAYIPESIHLPVQASFLFWAEVLMWFGIALMSAVIAYLSSTPGKTKLPFTRAAYAMGLMLVSFLFYRWSASAFAQEFQTEMNFSQGPCGAFVFVTGAFAALWMLLVIRRAAPLRLGFTSMWSVVSVGAIGAMFMHMVCTHESSLHVFVWHMLPLFALISLVGTAGKKVLRW